MSNPVLTAIRQGDQHRGVALLQKAMNERLGERLPLDGDYGDMTAEAVTRWQFNNNKDISGDCEADMIQFLNLDLTPTAITPLDIQRAANDLGVSRAKVMSIMATEVNWPKKSGYLPDRRPIILFERHRMYKYLGQKDKALQQRAFRERSDICNAQRGGYIGNAAEWKRMMDAAKYDVGCAYMSASWGLFQIMGDNYESMKYPTVFHMVRAMAASEGDQLNALVRFIKANGHIWTALKAGDWAKVARGYNGPAYGDYDKRMLANYNKFAAQGYA